MSYVTKFNLNDTAYFVDPVTLNIIYGTITDIYIHDTTLSPTIIAYTIRFDNITTIIQNKTKYNEAELFYLEEAKIEVNNLISKRETDIGNLR